MNREEIKQILAENSEKIFCWIKYKLWSLRGNKEIKKLYNNHVFHEGLMKSCDSYFTEKEFKGADEESWFAGTIPEDWEKRVNRHIEKLKKK